MGEMLAKKSHFRFYFKATLLLMGLMGDADVNDHRPLRSVRFLSVDDLRNKDYYVFRISEASAQTPRTHPLTDVIPAVVGVVLHMSLQCCVCWMRSGSTDGKRANESHPHGPRHCLVVSMSFNDASPIPICAHISFVSGG